MTNTENYGYLKPDEDDFYDINHMNKNLDMIDEDMKKREEEIKTHTHNYAGSSSAGGDAINAETATRLATPSTISIGTGVTGTATSFNGSENITIPVTAINATYITSGTIPSSDRLPTIPVTKGGTGAATLSGILKGNGTSAFSAATAGIDFAIPSGNITGNSATATELNFVGY